jgi:hypothetical protein
MTVLVDKCLDCFKTCFAEADGTQYHPKEVLARDVVCPDGRHVTSQHWSVEELRRLLDTGSPVFHCETHAYKWNPDPRELESLRELVNAFDGGGLPGAATR